MPGIGEVLALPAPKPGDIDGPLPPAQLVKAEDTEMEDAAAAADVITGAKPATVASQTRNIGMIHPPPDIRSIIDKTAHFVAKNGVDFERKIMTNEQKNVKFNFLNSSDPYHAYYQHRISEEKSGNGPPPPPPPSSATDPSKPPLSATAAAAATATATAAAQKFDISQFIQPSKVVEPPEAEQFLLKLPEGLTGQDLDIIKLTAQFVARNGKAFLTGLTSREHNSVQFSFLKPQHSLFTTFTGLTDSYSKVLLPPKGLLDKLKRDLSDKMSILERCLHRLEWERSQEKARQKAEDEEEQERMMMSSIDWHDFVVVETIHFVEEEDDALPAPVTQEEVIRRSKALTDEEVAAETGAGAVKEVEMEMDEEEMHLVEESRKAAARQQEAANAKEVVQVIVPVDEDEPPMRIVRNWKRPEERMATEKDPTRMVISPITSEVIPISEMAEHMRISLIDPKFKEQKERMMAKLRESTLATDDEISRNLMGLARLRPDIFGTTEEEVSNAVKAEIEKKKEEPKQVIWDGHSGSISRTANQALAQNAEEWDAATGAAKPTPPLKPLPPPAGLAVNIPRVQATIQAPPVPPRQPLFPTPMPAVPQLGNRPMTLPTMAMPHYQFVPGMPPPPLMQMQPPPPAYQAMPPLPDDDMLMPPPPEEPEPKRLRLEDSLLIPEHQFAFQYPGPIPVSVAVPTVEGEGSLKGQVLQLTMPSVSETIASLKEKIAAEIGLPANKQKLSGRIGFLRDTQSLAFYNIAPGESLTLLLRERGGKKKN
ncbi:hypothetical protein SELMODRAFT_114587 [Selaginella moellendorffii]|uniref:Splicing factor 3A subunit 1 n=1 Tax=Selaginella moellendorffii TaxID=88036 RepID=D8SDB1_SELML|nr:probable splicing factor 3A subunit 1 [Selaginella moellendorffii]EFJ17592.1 hypothetical protein SELMODRAFT_114587 [Selaginella moellendorffii]|eukprot:XP_002981404.1 probable splicing factor 3A subunit 1 [Selaginella moellendorffii]